MKLITYQTPGQSPRAGLLEGDRVFEIAPNVRSLLNTGPDGARKAADEALGRGGAIPLSDVTLRAPLMHPGKILALAGNYRAHRREGATPVADAPLPEVFCKPVTSVIGPEEAIRIPGPPVAGTDYEGELGVVIGKRCFHVAEQDAYSFIGGYLCVNDVSGRKLDPGFERPKELADRAKFFDWLIGKWPDTFCPIGPYLVTADAIDDPMNLTLVTRVNGEERQRTNTGEMIHSIARTIAYCSQFMTLEPGDIIATGTPAGVGSAKGIYLKDGDVVEVEITGLGVLRNPVVG
ncbi:MAG TPA: fumarylacetoacetate hydrolase family protein [Chloroflexota bacterium]|nr:fumarylacetoacetate hydrolase family protein [Chloroflexota bacterium]